MAGRGRERSRVTRLTIRHVPWSLREGSQGYLAHKKPPPPIGLPQDPKQSPTVGSSGGAVSYERLLPLVAAEGGGGREGGGGGEGARAEEGHASHYATSPLPGGSRGRFGV